VAQLVDACADRHDRLAEQLEPVLLARAVDARHPLHLAVALRRAALLVGVHAVAARVLGRVAGDVGALITAASESAGAVDLGEADADTPTFITRSCQTKRKSRIAWRRFSAMRWRCRACSRQQHAELVAAEARQRVGGADARLQHARDLLEQAVAGLVAAGVVDDLELVEVEVHEHVADRRLGAHRLQRSLSRFSNSRRLIRPVSASWVAW
jgi:hypothetical protein